MLKSLFSLILFGLVIQAEAQDFDKLVNAFKDGNTKIITELMEAKIEWSASGKEQMLQKSDASRELGNFFSDKEIKTFKVVHKGVSQNDVHYLIGELVTVESNFRITIYLKKTGADYLIQSLEIEQ